MSIISLRQLQGLAQHNNEIIVPSGHKLNIDGNLKLPVWSDSTRPSSPSVGSFGYNTDRFVLEIYSSDLEWVDIGNSFAAGADTGPGAGFSIAQGADGSNIIGFTNTSMTQYKSSWIISAGGVDNTQLNYGWSNGSYRFHTGHNANSTQWPFYFAFQATTADKGKVLNQIDWIKHVNAIGSVDIYGSNQNITSANFNIDALYTWLGRYNPGGYGSAGDGTVSQGIFNPKGYGYKWYMIKGVDIQNADTWYPNTGTLGGWAMYGLRMNKTSGGGARYWRYREGSAVVGHHPRVSRIIFTDDAGNDVNAVVYTSDNCSDSGTYIIGNSPTYDAGAGNSPRFVGAKVYSVYSGGLRSANYVVEYSFDGNQWSEYFGGVCSNNSACGIQVNTVTNRQFPV